MIGFAERLALFEAAWAFIGPALQRMDPQQTKASVWDKLESGHAQLWSNDKAAIVSQIEEMPNGQKRLFFWLAGGNRKEIEKLREKVEAFAREQGCTTSRAIMRPGFLKKRMHTNDKLVGLIMEREL